MMVEDKQALLNVGKVVMFCVCVMLVIISFSLSIA